MAKSTTGAFYQIGIVSWGTDPCAQPGVPGVYTSVQHHMKWIESVVN